MSVFLQDTRLEEIHQCVLGLEAGLNQKSEMLQHALADSQKVDYSGRLFYLLKEKKTYLLYTDHLKFDSDIIFIKKVFQQHFFIKNSTL